MMDVDRELSRRAAESLGNGPQSAWRTACRVLRSVSELKDAFYVEGWAVTLDNRLVIEHAWIEIEGKIIDPTRWHSKMAYFPVLRFDRNQVLEALAECPKLPVNWRGGARLRDNPAYHRAWKDARALAQSQLAQAKRAA
jgi:hypothetical protein